jgi:hypothetical protein
MDVTGSFKNYKNEYYNFSIDSEGNFYTENVKPEETGFLAISSQISERARKTFQTFFFLSIGQGEIYQPTVNYISDPLYNRLYTFFIKEYLYLAHFQKGKTSDTENSNYEAIINLLIENLTEDFFNSIVIQALIPIQKLLNKPVTASELEQIASKYLLLPFWKFSENQDITIKRGKKFLAEVFNFD